MTARKPAASASSASTEAATPARICCEARQHRLGVVAGPDGGREPVSDLARVTDQGHVGSVVLGRVGRVDVDADQPRRLGHQPVLGHHPVEVGPDPDHQVGLVPECADLGGVDGPGDRPGVVGRDQTTAHVGGDDGRTELVRERADRVPGIGAQRATAGPDERAPRPRR